MTPSTSNSREDLERLERMHAESPGGRYFVPLANAYRVAGHTDRAVDLLRHGIRERPNYLSAHIVLARCLADQGDRDGARVEFSYVLSLDPQNLIALRTLGDLALQDGSPTEAVRWYARLVDVDPMNDDARGVLDSLARFAGAPAGGATGEVGEGTALPASTPGHTEDDAAAPAAEEDEPDPHELDDAGATADPPVESHLPTPSSPDTPEGEWVRAAVAEEPASPEPETLEESNVPSEAVSDAEALEAESPADAEDELRADPEGAPVEGENLESPTEEDLEDALVTETIAELYVRQGFHSRAADVYRQLIRRHGEQPRLVDALRAAEKGVAPAAIASPPVRTDPFIESFEPQVTEPAPALEVEPHGAEGWPEEATDPAARPEDAPARTARSELRRVFLWGATGPALEPDGDSGDAPVSDVPEEIGPTDSDDEPFLGESIPEDLAAEPETPAVDDPGEEIGEEPRAEPETPSLDDPGEEIGEEPQAEPATPAVDPPESVDERPDRTPDEPADSFQSWLRSLKR